MKGFILLFSVMVLASGCALGKTAHQICSDASYVSRYKDYDQCYAEVAARKQHARYQMAHAFDGMARGQQQRQSMNCSRNGFGGYSCQ